MWINRAAYDGMLERALSAQGAKAALEQQIIAQKITQDWMVHRLTQLEHERAQLLYRYMDIKITVPELTPETPQTDTASSVIGSDLPSFNDVGDEEAKRLGLNWDTEGRVTQYGKVVG